MRIFLGRRAAATTIATAFVLSLPTAARATGITEFPDNGSEQGGRGGAWVARASDPLAAFYNPAGLAGQPTRLILQSNVNFQKTCFTRLKAAGDMTTDGVTTGSYPQVCSSDGAAVDPQIAFTYHLSDRIGLGFAPLLAPSAGASNVSFPEFTSTLGGPNGKTPVYSAGPTRYMLTSANLLVLNPTIAIGAEIIDRLRIGASFEWGIASLKFSNAVATASSPAYSAGNDIKATATATDFFVPGVTAGILYSATDDFDVAGWFKWSDAIKASGDIQTYPNYFQPSKTGQGNTSGTMGDTSKSNCGIAGGANLCAGGSNVHINVPEPMEAKVGFRYHKRRDDVPYDEHVRDPMSQDVFDVEADLTWANNSTFQSLQVRLPEVPASGNGLLPVAGVPGGFAPPNADVPHGFKDVYGVRLGGDYNVLRDQLTVRGGGFFQSNGQNPQYQNVDFAGSANFGFAVGGTYRIHLSHEKSNAIEVSLGFEHVFYVDETNNGPNGTLALNGFPCASSTIPTGYSTTCADGSLKYRTSSPINLGTITNSINVLNVGLGYKF